MKKNIAIPTAIVHHVPANVAAVVAACTACAIRSSEVGAHIAVASFIPGSLC
jgi:hypothetical protein